MHFIGIEFAFTPPTKLVSLQQTLICEWFNFMWFGLHFFAVGSGDMVNFDVLML